MTDTTSELPFGIALLPEGMLACAHCGAATTNPETMTFHVLGRERVMPGGSTRIDEVQREIVFGTCDSCKSAGDLARKLLDAHPALVRSIGSPSIALFRLHGALDVFALLGMNTPERFDTAHIREVLALAPYGIRARWVARFSPLLLATSNTKHCASEPWLAVADRGEATSARFHYLGRRLPPRPIICPSGGCLLCGIGSVLARRGDDVWKPVKVPAPTLGDRSGKTFEGHLCPACQRAKDEAGSLMLDAAALAAADPDRALLRKRFDAPIVNGLQAWAVTGREPNREPFEHVDLEDMRRQLAAGY